MANLIYNRFKYNLMKKLVDLSSTTTIKIALMKTGHSGSTVADNTWSQVSANELDSGSGYTTGGYTLANTTVTQAATTKWDNTVDPAWTTASFTAYYAVIYDGTELICSIDFNAGKTVASGTFTIQFDPNGIITLASA